jgi:hypothetical protein
MDKLRLSGVVLPKHGASFNILMPDREFQLREYGVENARFSLSVIKSDFHIEWDCPQTYNERHLEIYLARSVDIINAALSMVSFATGIYYFPHFERIQRPDGYVSAPVIFGDPKLIGLCKSYNALDMTAGIDVVFSSGQLMRAMRDLNDTMTKPHIVAINCTRVLETIKDVMTSNLKLGDSKKRDGKKWYIMRNALNIDRSYAQYITNWSLKHRHGRAELLPGDELREIWRRTWIIMDRFILYRKLGSATLDEQDYPTLFA